MQSFARNKKQFYFPVLVTIAFVVFGLYNLYFSSACKYWPNTIGIITNASVVSSNRGYFWKMHLLYEYEVNGVQYSCSTYRFGGNGYLSWRAAETVVARYAPGDSVEVFYDPNNPDHAVLLPGMDLAGWFVFVFCISWLIALVYFVKQIFAAPNSADTSFENAKNTTLPV